MNYLKSFIILSFMSIPLITSSAAEDQNKSATKKSTLKYYEFEELTIKVKIQEPEVLFILDKPNILVEPFEQNINFLEKIEEPILEDDLF